MEDCTKFAQLISQAIHRTLSQLADSIDAKAVQLSLGGWTDIEQIVYRQGIGNLLVVIRLNTGDFIGFFVVTTQLGSDFVVRHTNADGDPQLKFNAVTKI